jgi:hypothetical protein
MSASPAKEGDAAYVSKTDLIDWVNNTLQLQLTKLEQVTLHEVQRLQQRQSNLRLPGTACDTRALPLPTIVLGLLGHPCDTERAM